MLRAVTARRLPRLVALAALLLLGGAATASAHQFAHPKALRLGVREADLLLSVTLDVSPGREALQTRGLFDRDTSGALEEAEVEKLLTYLERTATLWLAVEVGGEEARLERVSIAGNQLDRPADSAETLGVSLLYRIPLPPGPEVTVRLRDRDRDRAKHVPLVVDLGPAWSVRLASQGEWHPEARQLHRITLTEGRPLELVLRR